MHTIIWATLFIAIIFGGVKLYDFLSNNEIACTSFQIVTKIEPYQKIVTSGTSNSRNRSTESETWYYVFLENGSIQNVRYLDRTMKIGNEICATQEWKLK